MRRSPANSTNRSFAAFGKLQHIPFMCLPPETGSHPSFVAKAWASRLEIMRAG